MNQLFINEHKLYETILNVTHSIDEELKELNTDLGVFFAPELYTVFEAGKAIFKNRKEIFGTEKISWERETELGNGGPSDLLFRTDSEVVVFEFKIASTSTSYLADIAKLQKLKNPDKRNYLYFIALIDSFRNETEPRIEAVYKESGYKPLYDVSFETNYSGYKKDMDCRVVLYTI